MNNLRNRSNNSSRLAGFCAGMTAYASGRRFRPGWPGTLLMLACIPLFLHLGHWQHDKATRKQATQMALEAKASLPTTPFPTEPIQDTAAVNFNRVTLTGEFDLSHQILIDNRIQNEVAGYYVITPLKLAGSAMSVLVNRGWIKAAGNHSTLPEFATPSGPISLSGTIVVPGTKFFTLENDNKSSANNAWQTVWQNLDLAAIRKALAYPTQAVVVQLDQQSAARFATDWPRPDEQWEKNLSYAYQWYGFTVSAILIWLVAGWRKVATPGKTTVTQHDV